MTSSHVGTLLCHPTIGRPSPALLVEPDFERLNGKRTDRRRTEASRIAPFKLASLGRPLALSSRAARPPTDACRALGPPPGAVRGVPPELVSMCFPLALPEEPLVLMLPDRRRQSRHPLERAVTTALRE